MTKAVAAAIPILLVSACSAQDVSYETEINNYKVPGEYTFTTYLDKDYARTLKDYGIPRINELIESHSAANPPVSGWARRAILKDLQKTRNAYNTAIKYVENDLKQKEAGRISFTYIKTNINGLKSSHERTLYCFDWEKLDPEKQHPIANQLFEEQKLNAFKTGDSSYPNLLDIAINPAYAKNDFKEIVGLSRKLCKRYFGKQTGQFIVEGIFPYPIKEQGDGY